MKKIPTLRFVEPLAAALMGAGFFILASALAGSPFYRDLEESLWARFQGASGAMPASAILIKGRGRELGSLAQRRLALARDVEILAESGAKAVVLEAWLDDASQVESAELLADLLDSARTLPKKSASSVAAAVSAMRARLNADASLAESVRKAGMVLLPAMAEPATALSPLTGPVWDKAHPYEVLVKGKGARRLESAWRLVRAPLEGLRDACQGVALLSPPLNLPPDKPAEYPAIFQVRGRWVNGIGFEAARIAMDLPAKGVHFLWREGRLSAVELRGARFPISPRGGLSLPPERERAQVEELTLGTLEHAATLKSLKGRVVFYQPWPAGLVGEEAFVQQRAITAGLLSGRVQAGSEAAPELWMALALGLLCALILALLRLPLAWLAPPALLAFEFTRFMSQQAPLARPLGLLLAGLACGAGLRLLLMRRRAEARRVWLRGHVASGAQSLWEGLLPEPGSGNRVQGCYIAMHSAEPVLARLWADWAESEKAFCEGVDSREHGFLIPLKDGEKFPLRAIETLRRRVPAARFSAVRGNCSLAAERVFESVRWSVQGSPKSEAIAMLGRASDGALLVLEQDYAEFRQNARIQLLGEATLIPGENPKKIFNIIGVF